MRFLEVALERALGVRRVTVSDAATVSGGCIHEARRLTTSAGEFFAKWSARCPPDIFIREAESLEALRSAGSEIAIPRVIAASAQDLAAAAVVISRLGDNQYTMLTCHAQRPVGR